MAIRSGMAGRLRPGGTGKRDDEAAFATHCLDVWEWEGGAGAPSVDIGLDPHATLSEYRSNFRRAAGPWRLLAGAVRPRARWAGYFALGAGLLAAARLGQRMRG